MKKPIPKRVFRLIAAIIFMAAFGYAVSLLSENRQPYLWLLGTLHGAAAASVLTCALLVLGASLLVLPIRMLSDIPGFGEELRRLRAGELTIPIEEARRIATSDYWMAAASGILLAIFGIPTAVQIIDRHGFTGPLIFPVMCVVCFGALLYYLLRAISSRAS